MPTYNTTNWVPVTMTDHLCAFASFVPLIEQCMSNPALGVSAENPLLKAYNEALEYTRAQYTTTEYDIELAKAAAVKAAYATLLVADQSPENPFIALLDTIFTEIALASKDTHELKDKIVKDMVNEFQYAIFPLYDNFKAMIDLDIDSDDEVPQNTKDDLKKSRYTEGSLFREFIQTESPILIKVMKEFYAQQIQIPENIYAARTNEIAYIATQLECVSALTVYEVNREPDDIQRFNFDINPAGKISMVFRNMNYHWEAAKLELGRFTSELVVYAQKTLTAIFSEELLKSPKLLAICTDDDAELNRIERIGQRFIDETTVANSILDTEQDEAIVNQKLRRLSL